MPVTVILDKARYTVPRYMKIGPLDPEFYSGHDRQTDRQTQRHGHPRASSGRQLFIVMIQHGPVEPTLRSSHCKGSGVLFESCM